MANLVITGIASAALALALTASIATPSMAMSFSDYDSSAAPLGSRADVSALFSGRLLATENRRERQARELEALRRGESIAPRTVVQPTPSQQRPISLTLPF
jgi:hypothetical protein